MNPLNLITGPDGRLSHTKLWANIGLMAITIKFFTAPVTTDLLMAYGALTSAHYLLKRWVDIKGVPHD